MADSWLSLLMPQTPAPIRGARLVTFEGGEHGHWHPSPEEQAARKRDYEQRKEKRRLEKLALQRAARGE